MKIRFINAEAFKEEVSNDFDRQQAAERSPTLRAFAKEHMSAMQRAIDRQPTIDAIPVDWIKQLCMSFPGMESAMWNKLMLLWEKEKICEQMYGERIDG